MAGLSLLPPAPKICSAAACSIGCLSPTIPRRLAFICSMSAATGARIAAEDAVLIVERVSGGADDEEEDEEGGREELLLFTVLEEEEDEDEETEGVGAVAAAATEAAEAATTPLLLNFAEALADCGTRRGPATPPRLAEALISLLKCACARVERGTRRERERESGRQPFGQGEARGERANEERAAPRRPQTKKKQSENINLLPSQSSPLTWARCSRESQQQQQSSCSPASRPSGP